MRYFLNTSTVAGRPFEHAGHGFEFEPVALRGGSWLGILALDDGDAHGAAKAGALASCGHPNIAELTEDQFNREKKNLTAGPSNLSGYHSQPRPREFAPAVADRAGRVSGPAFTDNGGPNSTENITRATVLGSTTNRPPAEPMLEPVPKKGRPY